MIGLIIAFILLALFVVYMTARHFELVSTINQHEEVLLKIDRALFPKNNTINFLEQMLGTVPKIETIDRLKQLEEKVDKEVQDGVTARKALEKYLDISYVKKESKSEGYEKNDVVNTYWGKMGYVSATTSDGSFQGTGMGYPLPDELKPKVKRSKKKAKKK